MNFLINRTVKRLIEAEQRRIDLNKSEAKRKYHQNPISAMKKVAEEYIGGAGYEHIQTV